MDQITAQQLKNWKNNQVGKRFFSAIENFVEYKREMLDNINPIALSQEELYKHTVILLTQIELAEEFLDLNVEDICEEIEEGKKDDTNKQ
jgi:hypothetical protein